VKCDYCHAAIEPHDVTFPPAGRPQESAARAKNRLVK
jgi:hypothetical protein